MKVAVELYSSSGDTLHAKGEVEADAIQDRVVVERNGHRYMYVHNQRSIFPAKFQEIVGPYQITEF